MARPRAERCKRGHLLAETRRTRANGTAHDCGECLRITDSAKPRKPHVQSSLPRGRSGPPVQLRLPFEPLERLYLLEFQNLSRVFNGTSLRRWRTEGIPILTADELACRIGRHPSEVYGQAWFAA